MFFLIKIIALILVVFLVVGVARTWQMELNANQALFVNGVDPLEAPQGFYSGIVPGHKVPWLGKKFSSASNIGINIFDAGAGQQKEQYPFKTSMGKGIRDPKIDVLKIDYNTPENPFWLKPILDEIVEVSPGNYLGKLHVRLIPGYPFTLAYFELHK